MERQKTTRSPATSKTFDNKIVSVRRTITTAALALASAVSHSNQSYFLLTLCVLFAVPPPLRGLA